MFINYVCVCVSKYTKLTSAHKTYYTTKYISVYIKWERNELPFKKFDTLLIILQALLFVDIFFRWYLSSSEISTDFRK